MDTLGRPAVKKALSNDVSLLLRMKALHLSRKAEYQAFLAELSTARRNFILSVR